jgi:hypothetical protein
LNSNYGIEFIILSNIFELTQISEGLKPIWKFELNQRKNVRCNCALWAGFSLAQLHGAARPGLAPHGKKRGGKDLLHHALGQRRPDCFQRASGKGQ